MKKILPILLIIISAALIVGGAFILNGYAISERVQAEAVAAAQNTPAMAVDQAPIAPEAVQGIPVHIEVPQVKVNIGVEKGYYNAKNGKWTLSDTSAFYGTMTAPANSESGNTFIYGHNADDIFGPLRDAQVGMKAIVTTDNGYRFYYTLQSFKAVSPNDVSLIQATQAPTLTLQTCSGTWYQFRTLYTFTLDRYEQTN
jgi:LPXTG-site transpeptidase (sortase) family protein